MEAESTGAEHITWNLTDLFANLDDARAHIERTVEHAEAFREKYRKQIAELSASELREALKQLEALHDRVQRAHAFGYLFWSTDTNDPKRGAFLQHVNEQSTKVEQALLFVEVEWSTIDEERATKLLGSDDLAPYEHYLEVEFRKKPYRLSEEEEQLLAEKKVTGSEAWIRFFDETMGAARFELDGKVLTQQQILSKLYEPDRKDRRWAALSFTDGLEAHQRSLTYIFNTLLQEKASNDRMRGYSHWLQSRNIANEVRDETVDALIEAVTSRYGLVARFYEVKKKLLQLDNLYDYDRYAPVESLGDTYEWSKARRVVLSAYYDFHDEMGSIAERFFEEEWIDAALAGGKRGGAFSHGVTPSAHPYILMNYTGKVRDVQTLAHEIGHGVHQYLAREQGALQASTPLTTAETASVFGEMLVFQRLLSEIDDPADRLAMLVSKIDDTMATVFRQVAMNRFEDRIHRSRRSSGELSSEEFCTHWMETQQAMFQGSVTLGEHYRHWWSYIPHFLHTPGYVYAYAFGELLVLALYALYEERGSAFTEEYIGLLRAGGSDWPHRLVGEFGVDLRDLSFWNQGLSAIESLVARAEKEAKQTMQIEPQQA